MEQSPRGSRRSERRSGKRRSDRKTGFRLNLAENWERGGGAFAVYYKGELVVDLWGGYSDKESGRLWREDTMNIAFSTTKVRESNCLNDSYSSRQSPLSASGSWSTST